MKDNKENKNNIDNNIYLEHIAKDEWNNIQAYHIETASAWRLLALVAIVALAFVACIAIYMVNQDKHKVLVFERDGLGNLSALGLATKTLNIDNKIIAHQLANFIVAIREVPQDVALKRRNINIVHKMSDIGLHETLNKMFITHYSQVHDGQVFVTINNIKPLEGGKSWEIRWIEESIGELGKATSNWSALVTLKRLDSVDAEVQLINPAGIFVTYFHPVEDINSRL